MVKAIFFDLDDTLLWDAKSVAVAFEKTCTIAQEKYDVDSVVLEKEVRQIARDLFKSYPTYPFAQMIGISPFEALWGNFADQASASAGLQDIAPKYRLDAWTKGLKACGIDDPTFGAELAQTFARERRENPLVFPETYKILNQLKQDYTLLLLTNGSSDLQKEKLTLTPELKPYFTEIIISGAFGQGKPIPAIFTHALQKLNLEKADAWMIGDNLHSDILGANRAGVKSVWVNRKNVENTSTVTPDVEIHHLQELITLLEQEK